MLYFMHECGICCCFSLGLFPIFSRIISIPSLQNKEFTLEPFQLNSPIKFYNLSVSPGHHQGKKSVMNKVQGLGLANLRPWVSTYGLVMEALVHMLHKNLFEYILYLWRCSRNSSLNYHLQCLFHSSCCLLLSSCFQLSM